MSHVFNKLVIAGYLFFCVITGAVQATESQSNPVQGPVILLHGLARSSASMDRMQDALEREGFQTCNINYPSTDYPVDVLAVDYILPEIRKCTGNRDLPLNFVTHSMGGIIVRYLANKEPVSRIGRVVMLSPPNRGSEVVDVLGDTWLFDWINGPAGEELGTDNNSLPLQLGPADFELGIITGNKSINLINSAMIDGADDGKVSVENAKLEGMNDFLVLPLTHPFIMKDEVSIRQTIHFLHHGSFTEEGKNP